MNKTLSNFILSAIIGLVFINCANRGTPDGGPKDETPPSIIKSEPENYSTNFKGNEIRVYFDEYIKIKDLQKQLIISPPMKTQPDVMPLGGASKYITIKIYDTLQPNTTYAFNFGNSITDNNEGNPYPYYRYVLSTGDYIDSLSVNGNIVDALKKQPETFVNVALYEVDSTFTDSIIYKETPKYITNTLDSVTTFSIENLKPGKYLLMALKDGNGDNKFQQKTDQLAFHKNFIEVPTDSSYSLRLFKEKRDFNATRPRLISGEKIAFGFEGSYEGMKIDITSDTPPEFEYRITKDPKTDTLNYWYKPRLEVDSLNFKVSKNDFEKEFTARISEQKRDTLLISTFPSGTIGYDEDFKISANTPLSNFDVSKISLMDKDSTIVTFKTDFDSIRNTYLFQFDKTEDNNYEMKVLPEAFEDFFGDENKDTLTYTLKTKKTSDFGYVRFTLVNATYPLIIQLTDKQGEVKVEKNAKNQGNIDFLNLDSGMYSIRVIHDVNGNKKFDPGNYLNKIQPEKVSHFQDIEIRADWGIQETLQFK
ncbi:MAG: Ig-like domain-containing protein [Algibacter sp.]|uniref:Ig-like domain-containing protein n=1 Tax=Algibacter sp. TaxID=1872428 RepID=UPI002637AF6B|nr:Ig-like domain-containing protein [Algibacter sp.]MDG1731195.1 Ig-like domain-containing protein [Algibacter sp.]MDG2178022.1 Ig-like domain-containing protein [Algibacter sp.]